ncbi:NADH-quinone oxidoreductase subunit M [Ereboglobus sp. PH5-5]|uniref:complex I subunit 4 family protein n=1 Tax=Ereboglobus sp. PH5-5 TaxID=2940529 RepID=UPI0024076C70|nr:NADH-quinone oxidoreductase subunit M [Ereboglobus sp. PH5-5]MDF9832874.1 NADH-quinone oxidoreductase subunit M [Ereboglobus sp. PH5-5]
MNSIPLLSLIIFTPWVGALLVALHHPRKPNAVSRAGAVVFSLSTIIYAIAAIVLPGGFNPDAVGLQLTETHSWIDSLNVRYSLGLDGLSLVLVLLTGIIGPTALVASWRVAPATRESNLYPVLFLLLQGASLGVFLAQDFFLWFLFWELSLFPAFFLIKMFGANAARATRAAYQFVIYTMGGSAFMLFGFAALYATTGTLDFTALAQLGADGTLVAKLAEIGGIWPGVVFGGVLLGLAVKVPLFPFHTWLPSAYAEAPAGTSMFLTAVLSKMGVYGFIRILWPIFPAQLAAAAPCLMVLALAGVVLGAFAAMRQRDLKRMIAYSSVNHLSYCLLALFAVARVAGRTTHDAAVSSALSGTILQMFNHGLSATALFYCIGLLEKRSGGLRGIGDFGGLRAVAPVFAGLCGVAMFSSLGLPGLNGFAGEFLIFRGVFGLAPWFAAAATLGLLVTALFLLTFWQKVFHGPVGENVKGMEMKDLSCCEIAPLVPAIALMFVLGIVPQVLAALFNPLVAQWTTSISSLP